MRRVVQAVLVTGFLATTMGVAPAVVAPCAAAAQTKGAHHAGLVVEFAKRPAKMFCVSFTESSITAMDLLQRTGLPLSVQDFGGGNLAVCSIDGEGCNYPRQSCWCTCSNLSDCTIWGFYTLESSGAWRFSDQGVVLVIVNDGDVVGWHRAKHTTSGGAPPGPTTLTKVCANGTAIGVAGSRRDVAPRSTSTWPAVGFLLAGFLGLAAWSSRRSRNRRAVQ